jgi:4a-hydroxytetrahydrobiopterin dehydratase
MVDSLASKSCTPCKGGIPPLTSQEVERLHAQVPQWDVGNEARQIERSFRFRNFREALSFVRQVGDLAEDEGHHPDISFGWGHATLALQTKRINGLHQNDFIMAAKIDHIFDQAGSSPSSS